MKKESNPPPEEGQTRPPVPPGSPTNEFSEGAAAYQAEQKAERGVNDGFMDLIRTPEESLERERNIRRHLEDQLDELTRGGFWTRIDTEETDSLIMTTSVRNVPGIRPVIMMPESVWPGLRGGCLVRSFNGFKNPATSSTGIVFLEGVHWSAEAGEFVPVGGGSDE